MEQTTGNAKKRRASDSFRRALKPFDPCGSSLAQSGIANVVSRIAAGLNGSTGKPTKAYLPLFDSDANRFGDFEPADVEFFSGSDKPGMVYAENAMNDDAETGASLFVFLLRSLFVGGIESAARRRLVETDALSAVVALPSDLFFGTSVSSCLLVFDSTKTDDRVLFVDAYHEFRRVDGKSVLSDDAIRSIPDVVLNRRETDRFSRLASRSEIANNGFTLSVERYVDDGGKRKEANDKERALGSDYWNRRGATLR